MSRHYILGNGAHSVEVLEALGRLGIYGVGTLGESQENQIEEGSFLYLGVGSPAVRLRLLEVFRESRFLEVRDPTSLISESASLGRGCFFAFGTVVSSNSTVEAGVLLNWNSSVGHDASVGRGSVLGPGARVSGWASIGSAVLLGANSCVLPGIKVADGVSVGAGAVVTRDVLTPGSRVAGIPARPI
jgi:UDP-perosamine 4-acetyltransferase